MQQAHVGRLRPPHRAGPGGGSRRPAVQVCRRFCYHAARQLDFAPTGSL